MRRQHPGAAALVITALVAAMGVVMVATPAAATNSLVPWTNFEIDGNKTASTGVDWDTLAASNGGPATYGYGDATDVCNVAKKDRDPDLTYPDDVVDDIADSGPLAKLDAGPTWKTMDGKATPSKSDLSTMYIAAEKVPVANGGIDDIIYVAYERCNDDSGSMIATLFIDNGDGKVPSGPGSDGVGDFLLEFEFNPGNNGATARVMKYSAGLAWVEQATAIGGIFDLSSSQTFGEAAVNLTKLRAQYDPSSVGSCFKSDIGGQSATVAGYNDNSSLIDIIAGPKVTVTNCGTLDVKKESNVEDTTTTFDYKVKRLNNGYVGAGQKEFTGDLKIEETDSYPSTPATAEFPAPIQGTDYLVKEAKDALGEGWSLETVKCTYNDIFTSGHPETTVTLYDRSNGGDQYNYKDGVKTTLKTALVAPGANTSCVITNAYTGIQVIKDGKGDKTDLFKFDVKEDCPEGQLPNDQKLSLGAGETAGFSTKLKLKESFTIPVELGNKYTITESLTTDAFATGDPDWMFKGVVCEGPDGEGGTKTVGTAFGDNGIIVTPEYAGLIVCTFTNEQKGKLIVEKKSVGGTGEFAIGGTLSGTIETAEDGVVADKKLSGEFVAGSDFMVTEDVPDGWSKVTECVSDDKTRDPFYPDNDTKFSIAEGETVTCTVINTKLGDLTLTKSVDGVADAYAWEFGFQLWLDGEKEGAAQYTGKTGDGAAADLTWDDLTPGETYVLTELDGMDPATSTGDFTTTWKCYDADDQEKTPFKDANGDAAGFGITVTPGLEIVCEVMNTAKPSDLDLTKTVEGLGPLFGWDFAFTLTPTGEDAMPWTAMGDPGDTMDSKLWALTPGMEYTIAEASDEDYSSTLTCYYGDDPETDAAVVDTKPNDPGITFTAGFDEHISCFAVNTASPSELELTKKVEGLGPLFGWDFDFTLTAAGEDPMEWKAMGNPGDTMDSKVWSLTPGTKYTIAEADHDDYTSTLACTYDGNPETPVVDTDPVADGITFVAGFSQSIECEAANTAKPSELDLTKTVVGLGDTLGWDFDFTLTPTGEDAMEWTATGEPGDTMDSKVWALTPGTEYTIAEETDDDYDQTLACYYDEEKEEAVEDDEPDEDGITFTAGFDEHIYCFAVNTVKPAGVDLTKTVTGVADDFPWGGFDFFLVPGDGTEKTVAIKRTIDGEGNDTSTAVSWEGLTPGDTYTVVEQPKEGYTTTLDCKVDGQSLDDWLDNKVTFVAEANTRVTCSAVNTADQVPFSLTKDVTGVADGFDWGSFGFTLTPVDSEGEPLEPAADPIPLTVEYGEGAATTTLVPGQWYTLEELPNDDYEFMGFECGVLGTPVIQEGPALFAAVPVELPTVFTFQAGLATSISCEATNAAKPTTLNLDKTVSGVDPEFTWSFAFTLDPPADPMAEQIVSGKGAVQDEGLTWTGLIPGQEYTITESQVDGYESLVSCYGVDEGEDDEDPTSVTFTAGVNDTIECDATNAAEASELSLTKRVEGVADGFGQTFTFLLQDSAEDPGVERELYAEGGSESGSVSWDELVPGHEYTVREVPADGYETVLTCYVVDDSDEGEGEGMVLVKDWDGEDDGSVTFIAGVAQSIECEAVNTGIKSDLTLTKYVDGVADGFGGEFSFLLINDPMETGVRTVSAAGGAPSEPILWEGLVPGETYTVVEQAVEGYDTMLTCWIVEEGEDDVLVADYDSAPDAVEFIAGLDQHIVCDAVNTAIPVDIDLTKSVEGVADGFEWSFDFTLEGVEPEPEPEQSDGPVAAVALAAELVEEDPEPTVGDMQTVSGMGSGSADPITWVGLIPGETYKVSETPVDGYSTVLTCAVSNGEGMDAVEDLDEDDTSVTFVAGLIDTIVCDAVNTAESASLELTKAVANVDAGLEWSFDFALDPEAMPTGTQTVTGTGPGVADPISWTELVPGETYTVSETPVDGFNTAIVCTVPTEEGLDGRDGTPLEDMDDVKTSFTFVAEVGVAVTCYVANVQAEGTLPETVETATLKLTKSVEGVEDDTDWSFDFIVEPDPDDIGTVTVEGTGNTTADTVSWKALEPGTTYTVTETAVDNYTSEFVCTGADDEDDADNTFTFTATDGLVVECDVTNTYEAPKTPTGGTKAESEELATTGADPWWALGLLALLTGGGATLLLIRRRFTH
ncbi:prealbumin-like fold domain-containing protein [Demequina salsinemoris]|uniref:prealbumin-like fold domain-containing protein n=1 Tax=Demequina salsinemoris TaxID=577470 RepID=UPI0007812093|nr:hypothetical protein [Demequina salsinemoris]